MIQFFVQPFLFHQFLMRSQLRQFTIFQNYNLVGIHDSAKSVSNHNDRLALHQFCNGPLD